LARRAKVVDAIGTQFKRLIHLLIGEAFMTNKPAKDVRQGRFGSSGGDGY
jgi:hypothetical protein